MAHPYAGNPVYPGTITIPDDGDIDAAAAYAVAFEQLADRCAALTGGGVGGSFTNASLHGFTNVYDTFFFNPASTLSGTVDILDLDITDSVELIAQNFWTLQTNVGGITIQSGGIMTIAAGSDLTISCPTLFDLAGKITIDGGSGTLALGNPLTHVYLMGADIHVTAATIGFTGAMTITLASTVTINSSAELWQSGFTSLDGVVCYHTVNRADGDSTAVSGATTVYEFILPNPALVTGIALDHTGAQLGQRVRFNAQKVSGPQQWNIGYAGKLWQMRNAAGYTVKLEFVSDGTAWVVDDWEAGGVALRNG